MKLSRHKDPGVDLMIAREGILQKMNRVVALNSYQQYELENLLRKLNYDEGYAGQRVIGALAAWAHLEIEQLKMGALVDEAETLWPQEDEGKG